MADAWRGRGFFPFLQLASRGQTGLRGAALAFNNTLLSPTPVDYSCRFRCTLSSFPRSLRPPRWHTCMSTGSERMNVHAHAENPAVTSTPFHTTPPYTTPSLLFIHASFQVPVPVPLSCCHSVLLSCCPLSCCPLCNRPFSHQIIVGSGSEPRLQQQERKTGWKRGETSREREDLQGPSGGQRERKVHLVVFSADHDLDYGPDFHLIFSSSSVSTVFLSFLLPVSAFLLLLL